jgi:hypothetical protein
MPPLRASTCLAVDGVLAAGNIPLSCASFAAGSWQDRTPGGRSLRRGPSLVIRRRILPAALQAASGALWALGVPEGFAGEGGSADSGVRQHWLSLRPDID